MAKFYGKNSGYLIKNDLKFFSFAVGTVILCLLLVLLIMNSAPPQITALTALFFIVFIIYLANPLLLLFKRKSNQFYRGWGGELEIKKELEKLPEDYAVFQDVTIGLGKGNIDFVVLAPTGVFILEVKSHKGEIAFNGYDLTINGRAFKDKNFFRQVHGQTWALKNYLKQQTGGDVFIHPAIVFSSPYASMRFGYNQMSNINIIQKNYLPGLFTYFLGPKNPLNKAKLIQSLAKTVN